MSYKAILEARKDAEAKMTPERLEGIRLGLKMREERRVKKQKEGKLCEEAPVL